MNRMGEVVSFGSVNIDRVRFPDVATLEELAVKHTWFPKPGETVAVNADAIPASVFEAGYDVFHGGKGANQAVAASLAGADTSFFGKVGPDYERFDVLRVLRDSGVSVDHVEVAEARTGTALIFVGPDGESHIAIVPGANGEVDEAYAESIVSEVLGADCLLLQNEVPMAAMQTLNECLADRPADQRPTVVFDPAPATGAGELLGQGWVDIITANESEYAALSPNLGAFTGQMVRTRGGDSVIVERDGEHQFSVTPPTVDPVDTTAAGDTFAGYLAARIAEGDSLRDAVELATQAAALSTQTEGAQPSIPHRDEVEIPAQQ